MKINEKLNEHERRINALEESIAALQKKPNKILSNDFVFSDKNKQHNQLLEELLKSDFCHSKNGITFEEILQLFQSNNRPIVPKKVRDLLGIWKIRKKIEAIKSKGKLRYFWIENE